MRIVFLGSLKFLFIITFFLLVFFFNSREVYSQAEQCSPQGTVIGSCSATSSCWSDLRIDTFTCANVGGVCSKQLYAGNPNCEPCTSSGCHTTTNPCGSGDSCANNGVYPLINCGFNGSLNNGPYASACGSASCCGSLGGPTPTPTPGGGGGGTPTPTPGGGGGNCARPGAVRGVAQCGATSEIRWSWGAVTGATQYELQTAQNSGFTSSVRTFGPINTNSFTSTNHAANTDFWGRVRVIASNGSCSVVANDWRPATASVRSFGCGWCAIPGSLGGSPQCSGTSSDINWSWGSVSAAQNYNLQTDRVNTFNSGALRSPSGISTNSYTTANHNYNVDIYARVRVQTSNGTCIPIPTSSPGAWRVAPVERTLDCAPGSTGGALSPTPTPYCTLNASPASGLAPLDVNLTANVFGGGGNSTYRFDTTNDGSYEFTSAATSATNYTYAAQNYPPGNFTARANVTRGSTFNCTTTVRVTPTPTLGACDCTTANMTPGPSSTGVGGTTPFTSDPIPFISPAGCTTVTRVEFTSSAPVVASVTSPDSASPYTTTATGLSGGSSTVTSRAVLANGQDCFDTSTLTVTAPVLTPTRTPTPSPTRTPTPTPTAPPGCTWGGWVNGACGGGGCPINQRLQTRTTNPAGCTFSTQCFADAACVAATNTPTLSPLSCNCSVNLTPVNQSTAVGTPVTYQAFPSITAGSCTVSAVGFTSTNASVATVSPASDSTSPTYLTTASALSSGSTTISAQVTLSDGSRPCSDSTSLTVAAAVNTPTPTPTPLPPPTTPVVNPASASCIGGVNPEVTFSWGAVAGADDYHIYRCTGAGCVPSAGIGTIASTSYTDTAVSSGTLYRYRVRAHRHLDNIYSLYSSTVEGTPNCASCSFDILPSSFTIPAGNTQTVSLVNIVQGGGDIDTYDYVVTDSSIASVCVFGTGPCAVGSGSLSTPVIRADMTGYTVGGNTTLTVTGRMTDPIEGGVTCTAPVASVAVVNPPAWWQAKEGDLVTIGNIFSEISALCSSSPTCDGNLVIYASGNFPGVPTAGGSINTGTGCTNCFSSSYNWRVSGAAYAGPTLTFDYFRQKLPTSFTPENIAVLPLNELMLASGAAEYPPASRYYYYQYNGALGDLRIEDPDGVVSIGTRKVIVFADSNVLIASDIRVTPGQGLFLLIASGNISVTPTVGDPLPVDTLPNLEGIYFTEGQFLTGTSGPALDQQLHVRGSVVAWDKVVLERDLTDNTTAPAELFEYATDQFLLFPAVLGERDVSWREVAP